MRGSTVANTSSTSRAVRRRRGVKGEGARAVPGEHAVQHERVDMKVQIEAPPESLDHGHRAPTTVRHAASRARARSQPEHGAHEHGDDRTTQVVVPRQLIPQAVRQAQHPLPHGHVGEHVIDQVGGALRHPAAAATGTDRAALAGKRDQPVEAAVATPKPREPSGEPAALQKVAELLLDEAGQAFAVAQAGGLRAEGLEVIAHDLVERASARDAAVRSSSRARPLETSTRAPCQRGTRRNWLKCAGASGRSQISPSYALEGSRFLHHNERLPRQTTVPHPSPWCWRSRPQSAIGRRRPRDCRRR